MVNLFQKMEKNVPTLIVCCVKKFSLTGIILHLVGQTMYFRVSFFNIMPSHTKNILSWSHCKLFYA